MTRDEMLLLVELNRLCAEAPAFALAFPDNNLPVADEYAFGFRLLDLAYNVLSHARARSNPANGLGDVTAGMKRQLPPPESGVIDQTSPNCPEG